MSRLTNERGFSAWPISHFIMYIILGIFSPDYWYVWVLIGIVWEFVEYAFTKNIVIADIETSYSNEEYLKKYQYNSWTGGTPSDIFFNITGLIVGLIVNRMVL